ncbi:MAG: hypothetical protein OES10_01380 [Gammaproteobacteria bacterium]|nr:hypothetical protein [Gammaproteobacteria bacterium]
MSFQFTEDICEDLMDPAYVDKPIGTEDQFERFIKRVEQAIDEFPTYGDFKPRRVRKRELKEAKKAVDTLRETLFSPGSNFQYLCSERPVFSYMFPSGPPDADKVESELKTIGVLIDLHLEYSLSRRQRKIIPPVRRFAAKLAFEYFRVFDRLPDKANKKVGRSGSPVVQSPFVNFLGHALDALVAEGFLDVEKRPADMKFLTKEAIKEASFEIKATKEGSAFLSPLRESGFDGRSTLSIGIPRKGN